MESEADIVNVLGISFWAQKVAESESEPNLRMEDQGTVVQVRFQRYPRLVGISDERQQFSLSHF
jgi:hypothetical protein